MEEFIQELSAALRAAGFPVEPTHRGIDIAGCSFRLWDNWRHTVVTVDGRARFRRTARRGFDMQAVVNYVIGELPRKIEELGRQQTAQQYIEFAESMQKTVENPYIRVRGYGGQVCIEFTTKETSLAMMVLDKLMEMQE